MAIYENTNLQEDYVSFETAKLLKEKGFDVECIGCYYKGELNIFDLPANYNIGNSGNTLSAPTLQMAMKWLREEHNVFIDISSRFSKNADKDVCFSYSCKKLIDAYKSSYEIGDGEWLNYEEAVEAAIKHCLKNLI